MGTAQRKDVFGSDSYLTNLGDSSEQARMIGMQRDARKNTDTLEEARRELIGTEKNAEDIQENLYEQRGKIEKIKANLIAGNTLLGRMGRTINQMGRREACMKVLWCLVIVILIAVIALIVYFSVKPKK